jgi:hypothetical protein
MRPNNQRGPSLTDIKNEIAAAAHHVQAGDLPACCRSLIDALLLITELIEREE